MLEIPRFTPFTFMLVGLDPIDELGAPADPTVLPVTMGFAQKMYPAALPTMYPADWQVNTAAVPAEHYVRLGIGTLTAVSVLLANGALIPGVWYPFVQPSASPENPPLVGDPFRIV
jgi:hypothetical protein